MTEALEPKLDQQDLNVAFYVKVFKKCLDAAEKISKERSYTKEDSFAIAETIFKQFFVDQTAMAGQARQTQAMVEGIHSLFQSRGR